MTKRKKAKDWYEQYLKDNKKLGKVLARGWAVFEKGKMEKVYICPKKHIITRFFEDVRKVEIRECM